jgi:phosphoribosylanthranilate isomerase
MTKIKICGITNLKDALDAVDLGADYLGFNFYKKSPRFVDKEKAKKIIEKIPDVKTVGIFVNHSIEEIKKISDICGLDIIQLSGDESINFTEKLHNKIGKKIIKTVRIKNKKDLTKIKDFKGYYILLDSFKEGFYGGTGRTFDLKLAKPVKGRKIFLSGGLNEHNVKNAVDYSRPFAVDVCSGIEKIKGIKDHKKMKEFIEVLK